MYRWLGIPAIVFLIACSEETPETEYSFRVYGEKGIRVAETTVGSKYDDELFNYKVVCTLMENPEEPDSYLGDPHVWFLADQNGYYYVADNIGLCIAVYNSDGEYIRKIGRSGDGPGEFRHLTFISIVGDTIGIWDRTRLRSTFYRTDGTLIQASPPSQDDLLVGSYLDAEGYTYSLKQFDRTKGDFRSRGQAMDIRNERGRIVGRIRIDAIIERFKRYTAVSFGWTIMPFIGRAKLIPISNGRILSSTGVEPILQIFNRAGKLTELIRFSMQAEPVSQELIRTTRDTLRSKARPGSEGDGQREFADAVQFPDTIALWQDVWVDPNGFYWLQHPPGFFNVNSPLGERYRVISPAGEYLGDTQTPGKYGRIMHGKYLTILENRETGRRTPTVFRITPVQEGLIYPN